MYLNNIVRKKDEKFKSLITYISGILSQQQMIKIQNHFKKEWKWSQGEKELPNVVMTEDDLIKLAQDKGNLQMTNRLTRSLSRNFSLKQQSIVETLDETQTRFKNDFINNFSTKETELELFKQNDEKHYEDY